MVSVRQISVFSIIILLCISISICSAQEDVDATIQSIKGSVWKRVGDDLIAYKAVCKDDITICNEAPDRGDCQEKVDELLNSRYMAEGKCDYFSGYLKEICIAIRGDACSSLRDKASRLMCEGMGKRNLGLFLSGRNDFSFRREHGYIDKSDAEMRMNLYYGFKRFSESGCDHFGSDAPFIKRISCELIFGKGNIDEEIDSILTDLAYFVYAKKIKKEKTFCDKIKNSYIKDACINPDFKSLDDLLK